MKSHFTFHIRYNSREKKKKKKEQLAPLTALSGYWPICFLRAKSYFSDKHPAGCFYSINWNDCFHRNTLLCQVCLNIRYGPGTSVFVTPVLQTANAWGFWNIIKTIRELASSVTILKQQAQGSAQGISGGSELRQPPGPGRCLWGDRKCRALWKEIQDNINRISNPEDCKSLPLNWFRNCGL